MASSSSPSGETPFDVAIVGGGPVGLSLAAALVRFSPGLRLALIDRRPLAVPKDNRASAISAGVRRVFEAIGVWPTMAKEANPIRRMKITDSGGSDLTRPLFLDFSGEVAPGEPFAHMVPNPASAAALLEALGESVEVIAPTAVAHFDGRGGRATLTLADNRTVAASLVVAADGGRSALRAMGGIAVSTRDYRQSGLVATIGHELAHEDTAYEHFRPAGPFASLPLPGQRSSLVWTETPDRAQTVLGMEAHEQAREIEAAMGASLGGVTLETDIQAFPLQLSIAQRFIAPRLALVGDAAHVIHPIAGQGLNLGLKDVAALAEVVVEALRLGEDPGAMDVLERYERWRRFDTQLMVAATDGLNRLFSNDVTPLRVARDFGLSVVDRIDPLKRAFIRRAAGAGPGPRLLEGRSI